MGTIIKLLLAITMLILFIAHVSSFDVPDLIIILSLVSIALISEYELKDNQRL